MARIGKLKIINVPETLERIFGLKDDDLVEVEVNAQEAVLKPVRMKTEKSSVQAFAKAVRNFPEPEITLGSNDSAREHDKYVYTKK